MKYLSQYCEAGMTKALSEAGAFYAFSNKQFDEARVEGVDYVQLGSGLICPVDNAKMLREAMDRVYEEGVQQDLAENGKKAIILRELANHEVCITGDIHDAVIAVAGHGITKEEVEAEFPAYMEKSREQYF